MKYRPTPSIEKRYINKLNCLKQHFKKYQIGEGNGHEGKPNIEFSKKHEREQPNHTLVLEQYQKAKYLYSGLKASSHTILFVCSVAFGTRGRYLTRRRGAGATEKHKILVCLLAFKPTNKCLAFGSLMKCQKTKFAKIIKWIAEVYILLKNSKVQNPWSNCEGWNFL